MVPQREGGAWWTCCLREAGLGALADLGFVGVDEAKVIITGRKSTPLLRITHKTLPDHPACWHIMAVFAVADAPLRARAVCEAMDLEITPSNVNNVRLKLKRLVDRRILMEPEQGSFTQQRP